MSIFLTGDTHIPIDTNKLNSSHFPEQKNLTRKDYLIVLGDFGLLWHEDKSYYWWKKWLEERKYTTRWLDGNHENHTWIDSLPESEWHGGKVHFVSENNLIHLMRGQVYTIDNKKFFTYGGALSVDKHLRIPDISWWTREEGSFAEEQEAIANLEANDYKVDYVLTHTCPDELLQPMFHFSSIQPSATGRFLDYVARTTKYQDWYFGHHHVDKNYGKFHCLYNTIIKLKE